MKKLVSLLLAALLALLAVSALAEYNYAEPITIQFWHTRGSGANADQLNAAVERFNTTNGRGITVEPVYQGSYIDTLSKIMVAASTTTMPQVAIVERASGTPALAYEGILYDMTKELDEAGIKMDNFIDALAEFSYYEGKVVGLPYVRSTPVYVYNKTMLESVGITKAPATMAEVEAMGKLVYKVADNGEVLVSGLCMENDPVWYLQNFLWQMDSDMFGQDGLGCPALADGKMLEVISEYRRWVDEGWCSSFTVTNASAVMRENFNNQKLASMFLSTGSLTNVIKNAKEAGFEVGVSFLPAWNDTAKNTCPTGGGNIVIIEHANTQQQIAASFEFVKFLMQDDEIVDNHIQTGYLPVTKSSVNDERIVAMWNETPAWRTAYDQLLTIGHEQNWTIHRAEWQNILKAEMSKLICDRSETPEEALENLKVEAYILYGIKY